MIKKRVAYLVIMILALTLLIPWGTAYADATYVVQQGDTLSSIARSFGTTVSAIVQANNLENPNFITVGQVLVIPGVSGEFDSAAANVNTSTGSTGSGSTTAVSNTTASGVYVIQSGDSLYSIAIRYGTTVADIVAANDLANPNFIVVGQEIIIPGGTTNVAGTSPVTNNTSTPTPQTTPTPTPAPAPVSANLLPNPSFEEGWHFYLYNELQIPDGWQMLTDEGANTLDPGDGGLFLRPECRVVSKADLPESEHASFVFNGEKTVKVFKGGAPTNFSLFTDIYLQPGTYRFTINFFPDTVATYEGSKKIWATHPLAAEARIFYDNSGTGWTASTPGTRNTLTYDFTLTTAASVRLGGSFRNRFVQSNNGWFLDNWSLQQIN